MSVGQGPNADVSWDGWFDQPFDCFWFNPVPNWGSLDPTVADDPTLDLDDTDGAGPEILNLAVPESGLSADDRYKFGVHHWSDNGHGPSVPEVRIYINGELTYSQHGPTMDGHDLWFVGEIAWPSGEVTPLEEDGGAVLIEDYSSPFMPN